MTAAYQLFKLPKAVGLDTAANVYPGAKLNFYLTGTTTRQDTYTTSALSVAHPNPVVADASGVFPAIYLDTTKVYKLTYTTSADVLIYTVDPVNDYIDSTLRVDLASAVAGSDGARLVGYKLNATGAVAQTLYSKESRYVDAADFGFSTAASAATNAAAIASAIAFVQLSDATYGGGTVVLPAGAFNCNAFTIPQYCYVRGRGYATQLTFASSGFNINIGATVKNGVSKYKCGFSDASILLTHKDGHAARMMETIGAEFSRVYVEGTLTASRSNRCLRIDGGDISSFFNSVTDVIANHVEVAYELVTTGTTGTTRNEFLNCTALGDVGSFPNSIGLRVAVSCGSGNSWEGGNFEVCGKGVIAENGCQFFSVKGACFEGNTIDVEAEPSASACAFIGCLIDNPGHVTNTTFKAVFIGCGNGSNIMAETTMAGIHTMIGQATGNAVLRVQGFPGDTTTETFQVINNAGNKLLTVTNQGKFARIANAAPATVTGSRGGNAALASLLTTLASYGLIVDGSS